MKILIKASKFINNYEKNLSNWWYQDELQKVRKNFVRTMLNLTLIGNLNG